MDNARLEPQKLRPLFADLLAWRDGEDLQPLVARTVELVGPAFVKDLPKDARLARERLIELLEARLENHQS